MRPTLGVKYPGGDRLRAGPTALAPAILILLAACAHQPTKSSNVTAVAKPAEVAKPTEIAAVAEPTVAVPPGVSPVNAALEALSELDEKTRYEFEKAASEFHLFRGKIVFFPQFTGPDDVAAARKIVIKMQTTGRAYWGFMEKVDQALATELKKRGVPEPDVADAIARARWVLQPEKSRRAVLGVLDEQRLTVLLNQLDLASSRFGQWRTQSEYPLFTFLDQRDDTRYWEQAALVQQIDTQQDAVEKALNSVYVRPVKKEPPPFKPPEPSQIPEIRFGEILSGVPEPTAADPEVPPMVKDEITRRFGSTYNAQQRPRFSFEKPQPGLLHDITREGVMLERNGWIFIVRVFSHGLSPQFDRTMTHHFMIADGRLAVIDRAVQLGVAYVTD